MNPLYNKRLKKFWKAFWEGSAKLWCSLCSLDTDLSYGLPRRSIDASCEGTAPSTVLTDGPNLDT